ncbi:MAG TPA: hypothetical protein VFJ85_01600 [Acidimicrobiales bacterium]|nr:hypothetical protein [Acidimicrobiales bacterium]
MADLEFFFDPICPWAWITANWVMHVQEERPLEVDWRFISLAVVNEGKGEVKEGHARSLRLLRVAAAVRVEAGPEQVLPYYRALGGVIHLERDAARLDGEGGIAAVLDGLGLPAGLASAATDAGAYDATVRAETAEALDRCGGDIGTPVLSFTPPHGPSFFGPVINKAPRGKEAVELWECVSVLGANPHFSELKRSLRGRPDFE